MDSQEARRELIAGINHIAAQASTDIPERAIEWVVDILLAHPETVIAALGGELIGTELAPQPLTVFVFPAAASSSKGNEG